MAVLIAVAALAGACASQTPKASLGKKSSASGLGFGYQPAAAGEEYFAEKTYGVKASPRVATHRSRMRRGGGRFQIGKPYKVKGRWYYPKEDKDYDKKGNASWYGAAFHGRLTANGEIYDMAQLTAAHPTMPLPSYARVTNLENGHSVMVRVNDRGPFAHNRIIDLSARAAQLLDYTHDGTAKVRVQYAGRAPLHGQDDEYLLASYQRGDGLPGPSGLPGTMVAMATPAGSPSAPSPAGLPGVGSNSSAYAAIAGSSQNNSSRVVPRSEAINPANAIIVDPPIPTSRPTDSLALAVDTVSPVLSYADQRIGGASAFDLVLRNKSNGRLTATAIRKAWERETALRPGNGGEQAIYAGSFGSDREARATARKLAVFGRTTVTSEYRGDVSNHVVNLMLSPDAPGDEVLRFLWQSGLSDAFVIRQ